MFMCPRAFMKEDNSARIEYLHNNSGVSVPVRLLAIKESIECHVKECDFNAPNYNGKVCRIVHNQLAYLYVYTQTGSKYIEHRIVAFVGATVYHK